MRIRTTCPLSAITFHPPIAVNTGRHVRRHFRTAQIFGIGRTRVLDNLGLELELGRRGATEAEISHGSRPPHADLGSLPRCRFYFVNAAGEFCALSHALQPKTPVQPSIVDRRSWIDSL